MKVQLDKYNNNFHINHSTAPTFKGGAGTIAEKLGILLSETKKLYYSNSNISLSDFESIIKKISPTTIVKPFSEVPPGSNISPRAGAYFSQITDINSQTNEMIIRNKIIYINFKNSDAYSKLKLFGDFIHEATHIIQEEATDRISSADFSKKMLYSAFSAMEKKDSLIGGIQGFKSIEYNIVLPLVEALRKCDEMPRIVPYADKNILNMLYANLTNQTVPQYIKNVTKYILQQLKTQLPLADENYILGYVHKKAGHEKEAYQTSLKFLKDVLKIKGDTDLDFRILLYDEFEKQYKI